VGIPQFALAEEKSHAASGLTPFDEGLGWLKAHGYRAVLHLRPPGQKNDAERERVETKHGLKYLSLEVSPETLTRATEDRFNKIIGETANQPLFVYDEDGVLAGGLWYLHFRFSAGMSDEQARAQARSLGLRDDPSGEAGVMWLAIQKYLSKR
jgi:protein tyrosine phosphatase (PTP) superfamily phosphohydrolase (DUF442 family)